MSDLRPTTNTVTRRKSPMSPCPFTRSALARTGALALVFGLALGQSAWAATDAAGAASTVRAVIGEDGSVSSVTRTGGANTSAPSKDELPVSLSITDAIADGVTTTSYRIKNTTAKKEQISYVAASGKTVSEERDVSLPLVGQLRVTLPKSYTDVQAAGAAITTNADGTHELLWSMILFAPIGSNVADLVYSAKGGNGEALARLDVAPVIPNSTPGLSATAQSANADINGNAILSTLTLGANDGLTKLSAGVAKLLDGLLQLEEGATALADGLGAGASGAQQLADGLRKAKAGSGALNTGLQQLSTGSGKLDAGLQKASDGSVKLVDGSQALATGAGLTADGAAKLSAGLGQISGGLAQLNGTAGLPAALDGAKRLRAGVDLLLAGLGSSTDAKTILGGLAALGAGLPLAKGGVDQVAGGLSAAVATGGGVDRIRGLVAKGTELSGCPVTGAPSAAPSTNCEYLNTAIFALSHPAKAAGATDPGGLKEQLALGAAGLGQVSTGLGGAITGVGALSAGVTQVKGGLKSGDAAKPGIAEGLDALVAGLTAAVGGIGQLAAGATAASTGSVALADGTQKVAAGAGKLSEEGAVPLSAGLEQLATGSGQLAAGAGKAAVGSTALDAGIGKISAGQDKVAAGLPRAVAGAGKIAAGLGAVVAGQTSVAQGLSDVKTKATGVVADQLSSGSDIAKSQLAGLDATAARVTGTPGAATTTYVFAQDGAGGISLTKSSSESNTGRNIGLGAGAVVLLLAGVTGGYLSGRRKVV